jgi:dynein intermediate chain, cytosolic
MERSSKVIERALDEDYDLLADYTLTDRLHDSDDDPTPYSGTSKKVHSLRQTLQLYSERHSRKRMISDIQFSPHFPRIDRGFRHDPAAARCDVKSKKILYRC